MKLFLVRHAQGEGQETIWQTPTTSLSDLGIQQSLALSRTKRFATVTQVYSSKLTRAKQTAELLTKDLGKTIEERDDIQERAQSSRIYGLSRNDTFSKQYWEDIKATTNDWSYKWDNEEESKLEVRSRAVSFKNFLEQKHPDSDVLAVTHENFLKHFITVCILGPGEVTPDIDKLYRSINIKNTGTSLLVYDPHARSWKIWYINDYSHLGSIDE